MGLSGIRDPEKIYSGSKGQKGTGSRIQDPDPQTLVFGPRGSGSGFFYHQTEMVRKTLIPLYCFVTSF
jgi:hypothetical protein